MRYSPVAHEASIVVAGNLNPAIFSPAWFRLYGLIDDTEFEAAKVGVIHPEITEFSIDSLTFHVTQQQLSARLAELPFVRVADIVGAIFGELLPHTPLTAVGFNVSLHFRLETIAQRVSLGRSLAPLAAWGAWGDTLESSDALKIGGVRDLTMEQTAIAGRSRFDYRRFSVQPSVREQELSKSGVFMLVNDHYQLQAEGVDINIKEVLPKFDTSISFAHTIISHLMDFSAGLKK